MSQDYQLWAFDSLLSLPFKGQCSWLWNVIQVAVEEMISSAAKDDEDWDAISNIVDPVVFQ